MPVYEYRCRKGHKTDAYRTVEARGECPLCACGAETEKIISTPPRVFSDYQGYVSPASGKWVEGRNARREDFARTGTRPYDPSEKAHFAKARAAENEKFDDLICEKFEETVNELTH